MMTIMIFLDLGSTTDPPQRDLELFSEEFLLLAGLHHRDKAVSQCTGGGGIQS